MICKVSVGEFRPSITLKGFHFTVKLINYIFVKIMTVNDQFGLV
jgi:hypothetical protein